MAHMAVSTNLGVLVVLSLESEPSSSGSMLGPPDFFQLIGRARELPWIPGLGREASTFLRPPNWA